MSISLSTIQLRDGLIWTDRWSQHSIVQKSFRTLGGLPKFYYAKTYKNVPITLASLPDSGWQTKETVEQLLALAKMDGGQFVLTIGADTFSVMFDHENAPAFDAQPIIPRGEPVAGDWFTITLKLVTV